MRDQRGLKKEKQQRKRRRKRDSHPYRIHKNKNRRECFGNQKKNQGVKRVKKNVNNCAVKGTSKNHITYKPRNHGKKS